MRFRVRIVIVTMAIGAMLVGGPVVPVLSATPASKERAVRDVARCWPGREVVNPGIKGRKPLVMPGAVAALPVTRTIVALKLCVRVDGAVERVLVLRSSGNPKVDAFFREALMKWTLAPVLEGGRAVNTVAEVAITFHNS